MPTMLPVNFSALPLTPRPQTSILNYISYEMVGLAIWSLAMLAIGLLAIHRGLPVEAFSLAFQ